MSSQDLGGENDSKSSFPCPLKNLIAPDDLKQEALSLWDSGRVLRAWLGCEELFPLVFSAGTPTPGQLQDDFAVVESWKISIEEHCKCHQVALIRFSRGSIRWVVLVNLPSVTGTIPTQSVALDE